MRFPRLFVRLSAIMGVFLCSAVLLRADTATLVFDVGVIRDRTGAPVAVDTSLGAKDGTLGILVASASGNFASGSALFGSTLSTGNRLGTGDNVIVATFHAVIIPFGSTPNAQTDTQFSPANNITIDSSIAAANTNLALYWFPGITADGTTLSLSTISPLSYLNNFYYGSYRNDRIDALSNTGWVVPAGGSTLNLFVIDKDTMLTVFGFNTGALASQNDLSALNFFAIPEPSSIGLLAAGGSLMAGAMLRRRNAA